MPFQQVLPKASPQGMTQVSLFRILLLRSIVDPLYIAIDLLERLLQFDPAKRITCAEALKHPYFTAPTHQGPAGPLSATSPIAPSNPPQQQQQQQTAGSMGPPPAVAAHAYGSAGAGPGYAQGGAVYSNSQLAHAQMQQAQAQAQVQQQQQQAAYGQYPAAAAGYSR